MSAAWTPQAVREAAALLDRLDALTAATEQMAKPGARMVCEVWGGIGVPRLTLNRQSAEDALVADIGAVTDALSELGVEVPREGAANNDG